MTPLAKAELHDFCEAARKRRILEQEPHEPADPSLTNIVDTVVACVCASAMLVLSGVLWAEHQHEKQQRTCPLTLPDGRALNAYHLGLNGQERCTYEAPKTIKGKRA